MRAIALAHQPEPRYTIQIMKTTSLAAILFVELSGFHDLLERNESAAIRLLGPWRTAADPVIARHGGELVDATGDELLVIFQSAVAALQCAIDIREAARDLPAVPEGRLKPRAGIHLGEIWRDESRVYGNGINVAARVKAEAGPGQILVSEDIWRQVSNKLDLPIRPIPERHLKNIERNMAIYEAAYEEAETEMAGAPPEAARKAEAAAPREPQETRKAPSSTGGPARDMRNRMDASPPAPAGKPAMDEQTLSERIARLAHEMAPPPPPPLPRVSVPDKEVIKAAVRNAVSKSLVQAKGEEPEEEADGEAPSSGDLEKAISGLVSKAIEAKAEGGEIDIVSDGNGTKIIAGGKAEKSPAERRAKASGEISKGVKNLFVGLAALGGFGYFYLQKPGFWLGAGAILLGFLPALSGLKKLISGIFAWNDARKDEKEGR